MFLKLDLIIYVIHISIFGQGIVVNSTDKESVQAAA